MSLTPLTIATALNVPNFYQNKQQFWHMLNFLFTNYENKPVWTQVSKDTYHKMGIQLWQLVNDIETEAELNGKSETLYKTYYTIMRMTRVGSNSDWHAYSSLEFLNSMYRLYRQMYNMRTIPDLPLFGHLVNKL
jgi:hypothetical protein|tara:strand:+ start:514 stop:915 length:402 start_codon:yes stop_codon:yes gene_type:complete